MDEKVEPLDAGPDLRGKRHDTTQIGEVKREAARARRLDEIALGQVAAAQQDCRIEPCELVRESEADAIAPAGNHHGAASEARSLRQGVHLLIQPISHHAVQHGKEHDARKAWPARRKQRKQEVQRQVEVRLAIGVHELHAAQQSEDRDESDSQKLDGAQEGHGTLGTSVSQEGRSRQHFAKSLPGADPAAILPPDPVLIRAARL